MANNVKKGGDMMLFLGGKSIALATSHTLSISADAAETSNKDNGGLWASSEINKVSWTVSSENLYSVDTDLKGEGFDGLFDAMVKGTKLEAVFAPKAESADEAPTGGWNPQSNAGYTGKVIVTSLSMNAANGDNTTYSVELTGVGELKPVKARTQSEVGV